MNSGFEHVRSVPVVEVVTLCVCLHQESSHVDARVNDGDERHHPGPCKDCGCRQWRPRLEAV